MRPNLINLLDFVGLHKWLGIESCAMLFGTASHLVQTTSVLRNAVFLDGGNYSGAPSMLRQPLLREHLLKISARISGHCRTPCMSRWATRWRKLCISWRTKECFALTRVSMVCHTRPVLMRRGLPISWAKIQRARCQPRQIQKTRCGPRTHAAKSERPSFGSLTQDTAQVTRGKNFLRQF